ncbi:hypothetical protein K438DRAFT_1779560 [Mycena galopus ATCC 62051]|nr:hypothetical protein K438DRAFT_1779560 [Mycena galopus ATCC 62051]
MMTAEDVALLHILKADNWLVEELADMKNNLATTAQAVADVTRLVMRPYLFILPPPSGPAPRFKLFRSIYRQQWMGPGLPRTFGRAAAAKDGIARTPPVVSSAPIASGTAPFTFPAFSQCGLNLLLLVQVKEMFLMTAMPSIFSWPTLGNFFQILSVKAHSENNHMTATRRGDSANEPHA